MCILRARVVSLVGNMQSKNPSNSDIGSSEVVYSIAKLLQAFSLRHSAKPYCWEASAAFPLSMLRCNKGQAEMHGLPKNFNIKRLNICIMQWIILLLSNISILDPQLSENLLNASRAYSIQLFSNNTPGMLLPPLPFFICHPTGHISNASALLALTSILRKGQRVTYSPSSQD
jgi:hypothetical protein